MFWSIIDFGSIEKIDFDINLRDKTNRTNEVYTISTILINERQLSDGAYSILSSIQNILTR